MSTTDATAADPAFAHDPDRNPQWTPKMAYRIYACVPCGAETMAQTNHTGYIFSQRCTGKCRTIHNAHTAQEIVEPGFTRHRYVREAY